MPTDTLTYPIKRKAAIYHEDGSVDIAVVEDGLPQFTSLLPAPFMSEVEREAEVAAAKQSMWMNGYFIASERRIRNRAFDKRGQATTTKFVYRTCKTQDEAAAVFKHIVEARA